LGSTSVSEVDRKHARPVSDFSRCTNGCCSAWTREGKGIQGYLRHHQSRRDGQRLRNHRRHDLGQGT
jgi:hypothetical protein